MEDGRLLETHPPSWLVPFFWKPRATPTSHWYHPKGGGANRGLSSIFKIKNFMGNNKLILTLFAIYVLLNLLPQTIFVQASSDLWWGDFSTNWWQRVIFNSSDFVYLFFIYFFPLVEAESCVELSAWLCAHSWDHNLTKMKTIEPFSWNTNVHHPGVWGE